MPSIADAAVRKVLERRLARLTPRSTPRWGRMNVHQMLDHVAALMEVVLRDGAFDVSPRSTSGLQQFLALRTPVPWPKNLKTGLDPARNQPSEEFDALRDRVSDALREMSVWQKRTQTPRHPAFGDLTTEEWQIVAYKHAHHHLKQFGV